MAILLFAIALQVQLVTGNMKFVAPMANCDNAEISDMAVCMAVAPDAPLPDIANAHR